MWQLARTPRWIGGLVFALALACVFGLLGQWQISRAVDTATHDGPATETVVPLTSIAEPQTPATQDQNARMVTVEGTWVGGDFGTLGGRHNDGREGWWVTGHLQAADDAGLAVAIGWAPSQEDAQKAAASAENSLAGTPAALTGRYLASESPTDNDIEAGERRTMAVPELINLWGEAGTVYDGYLVASTDQGLGLTAIDSPRPEEAVTLNWLNVFYAIEWVVFALLAFYMWFRLLRDAYERRLEDEQDERDERDAAEDRDKRVAEDAAREASAQQSAGPADVR
jgi:cytochrome oxidase assembly protein ShyY1